VTTTPEAPARAGSDPTAPPAAGPGHAERLEPVLLDIEGLKCGGCVRAAERVLQQQPGVRQASVNLVTRTAWVGLDPAAPGAASEGPRVSTDAVRSLVEALAGLGFTARPRDENPLARAGAPTGDRGWWQVWRQLVVALTLLLLSGVGHLQQLGIPDPAETSPAATLLAPLGSLRFHALLATVALAGPGRAILSRGARAALAGMPSMDTLVGLGVGSAYLASMVAWIWPGVGWQCFFNEPVMLLGFVLLGRFLEARARRRTGSALEQLASLQPDTARLLMEDGSVRTVRVGGLRRGDRVRLLAGDRVPVDGIVREGESAADVSSLTGEPMPIEVTAGCPLTAGSLNLNGTITLEVQRTGSATALARIIRLVEQAQARKAPIQSLADRIAGGFSLFVVLLAAATFLFWWQVGPRLWPQVLAMAPSAHVHGSHVPLGHAAETPLALGLQLAIAVLVVACPCALGLATPTVITVATGLAARRGWLFRGGDVIEATAAIRHLFFDKTGTLTRGRPMVTAVAVMAPIAEDHLVRVGASLEQDSRHPLAHALLQEAQRRGLDLEVPSRCRTVSGAGVQGSLASEEGLCRIGSASWLEREGVLIDAAGRQRFAELERLGGTVLAVAADRRLLGLVAVSDALRPDASEAVTRLRTLGLDLAVLSGDRRPAVARLGDELGLEDRQLLAGLRPEDKLARIGERQGDTVVAMVGDGINDAPALAAADVGIAVGTGTQIAQDTADLVILGDRLADIPRIVVLARRTMARIRQNLFWAFGYNLIALPVAAGVLLPGTGLLLSPPLAALLMALSSITVVLNALALAGRAGRDLG
jgi:Cu2+-exporting ATPase